MDATPLPAVDEPRETDHVRVPLRPDLRAPSEARRAVRDILLSWRLPGLVDSVVLAVSELVTNAVRHGLPPVHVVLRREPACVRLDVHDARPTEPSASPPHARDDAESGRGLEIVHSLAADVGCDSVPGDGKVLHASFPTAPDDRQE